VTKEIVIVRLATYPNTGIIIPDAPFLVSGRHPIAAASMKGSPTVIAQFLAGEEQAGFEAEGRLTFACSGFLSNHGR